MNSLEHYLLYALIGQRSDAPARIRLFFNENPK